MCLCEGPFSKNNKITKKGNIVYNVIPEPGKFPVVDSKVEHTEENNHVLQNRDILAVLTIRLYKIHHSLIQDGLCDAFKTTAAGGYLEETYERIK